MSYNRPPADDQMLHKGEGDHSAIECDPATEDSDQATQYGALVAHPHHPTASQ